MAIFERDKLPAVANVEQVRDVISATRLVLIRTELRDRCYGRGQDTQNTGRRDGPPSGQPRCCVGAMTFIVCFLGFR